MKSESLKNLYLWGLKLILLAIPFLSLWIATSMFFPYITGRNFVFRILIALALVLWAGLMVLDKRYRPKSNLMLWVAIIFMAVIGIANLLGVDPYHSFWSRFERMEGYLMFLHLFAYFLILTSVFKTKKEWLQFFTAFVIAGTLVGAYGALQALGIKEAIQGGGVRIDGTIGNPTYLAAYLVLISALALLLFFNTSPEKIVRRYFYAGVLIFNAILLYFTASRGAAVALLITIPLFLIFYLIAIKERTPGELLFRKIAIGGLVAIVLLPLLFLAVKNTTFVRESNVLSRFASLSLGEQTVRSRFTIWKMSWQGFLERPILGWGQENYMQVFSKYFDPKLYDQEPWFDRPHNIVFEWLINAGIMGLVSYLSLFVALYVLLWSVWRRGGVGTKEALVLAVAPLAYFIQNLFVFDNFNTYILFFALLGYVSFLDRQNESDAEPLAAGVIEMKKSLAAAAIVLIAMIVASYFINIKPMKAAQGIILSLRATTDITDPFNKTMAAFEKTLSYKTFGEREAVEQLGRVATALMGQQVPQEIKGNFFNFSIPYIEEYLERFPNDIRVYLFLSSLYNSAASIDNAYIFKARENIQKAIALSPTKQQIYYSLADNYLRAGEGEKALSVLQHTIDLEPGNSEAHTNKAVAAILLGRNDIVVEVIEDLNQLRLSAATENQDRALGTFLQSLDRIGDTYIRVGETQNARAIYTQLFNFAPESSRFQEILNSL